MDILSLKANLLKQNKIYKKQTLKKDALIFCIVAFIFVAIGAWIFGGDCIYIAVVASAIFVIICTYLFLAYKKTNKSEKQIERFIDKIKAGGKAIDIREYGQYRIALSLPVSKLLLFPVHYISIAFASNPSRYYTFAVDQPFTQEIRSVLKENSNNLTSAAKHDFLDADLSKDSDQEHLPLKNVDEFKDFLNKELQFSMSDIEEPRRISKPMLVIASILLFTIAIGWLYYMYILLFADSADLLSSPYEMLLVGALFFVVFYGVYYLYFREDNDEYLIKDNEQGGSVKSRFKSKILHQVVKFINPQAQYVMHGHIDKDLIIRSGLFKEAEYQTNGNDLIIGKYNGVRFQFSDLQIKLPSAIHETSSEAVFQGQYFVARLRKTLPCPVYLVYRKAKSIQSEMSNINGSEIELDDKDFMKLFSVYASSIIYAQEVLTPVLIEGLKRVIKRIPGDYYISFCGDLLTIANNSGKDSFEIEYASSLIENDFEILIGFFKELYGDLTIINDLRLNEYA